MLRNYFLCSLALFTIFNHDLYAQALLSQPQVKFILKPTSAPIQVLMTDEPWQDDSGTTLLNSNLLKLAPEINTLELSGLIEDSNRFSNWEDRATQLIPKDALNSSGGFGAGNGGGSIVCRDKENKIQYVEFFDNWEGNLPDNNDVSAEVIMEKILQRTKILNPWFYQDFKQTLDEVYVKVNWYLAQGRRIRLERIFDSKHVFVDENCPNGMPDLSVQYEQVVNYTDNGLLLVNKTLFSSLSEIGKASLYLHEALYKMFRDQGDKDSVRARTVNVALLSQIDDEVLSSILLKNLGMKYLPQRIFQENIIENFKQKFNNNAHEVSYVPAWDFYLIRSGDLSKKYCSDCGYKEDQRLSNELKSKPLDLNLLQQFANKTITLYKKTYPSEQNDITAMIDVITSFLAGRVMQTAIDQDFNLAKERSKDEIVFQGQKISVLSSAKSREVMFTALYDYHYDSLAQMYRSDSTPREPEAKYLARRKWAQDLLPKIGDFIASFLDLELANFAEELPFTKYIYWKPSDRNHYYYKPSDHVRRSFVPTAQNFLMTAVEGGSINLVKKILSFHQIGDDYSRAKNQSAYYQPVMAIDYAFAETTVKNCQVIKEVAKYTKSLDVGQSFQLLFSGCR